MDTKGRGMNPEVGVKITTFTKWAQIDSFLAYALQMQAVTKSPGVDEIAASTH